MTDSQPQQHQENARKTSPGDSPANPAPAARGTSRYAVPYYDLPSGAAYYGASVPSVGFTDGINLRHLVRVIRRKWMTIGLTVLFMFVCSIFYLLVATKVYRATSLVELSVRRPRIAGQQGAVIDDTYNYAFQAEEVSFITRLERLKGLTMQNMAIAKFRTYPAVTNWPEAKLRKTLEKHVDISLVRRSRLAQISFDYKDPLFAMSAANAYAEAAQELAFAENKVASDNAVVWLESQAEIQRKAVEKADQALVDFRAQNKLDVLESQKRTAEESLVDFNKALTEIESQKVLAMELYNTLVTLELKPENAGNLPASIPRSEEVKEMLDKWLLAISERDALLTRYTKQHPEVVAKDKVIDVLRTQALEAIQRSKQTASSNLDLLQLQAASFREKITEQSGLVSDLELRIVEKKALLSTLERSRDAADISYRGILTRIEEARLSADENTATVKIVERAGIPERPIRPRKLLVLAFALFLGSLVGFGLGFVTDTLEDHVTGTDDLERDLGLKILGLVPNMGVIQRKELALSSLNDKYGYVAETYAGVRSILDSMPFRDFGHSVLIVSTAPEEGKTVTACNLAIMSARSGVKTLLVDFDMRRPRIGDLFDVPQDVPSIEDALQSDDALFFERLPFKTVCDRLEIIVSRLNENLSPADLIAGRGARHFMDWAKKKYQRVILDSPPFGLVNDSVVLAGMVGCVIMVCRPDHSRKKPIRRAVQHFDETGANVIGMVVNDVNIAKGGYSGYNMSAYKQYHKSTNPSAQAES